MMYRYIIYKYIIDILPFFSSALKKCGPIVHYSIFGKSYVLLNDPNDVKVSNIHRSLRQLRIVSIFNS